MSVTQSGYTMAAVIPGIGKSGEVYTGIFRYNTIPTVYSGIIGLAENRWGMRARVRGKEGRKRRRREKRGVRNVPPIIIREDRRATPRLPTVLAAGRLRPAARPPVDGRASARAGVAFASCVAYIARRGFECRDTRDRKSGHGIFRYIPVYTGEGIYHGIYRGGHKSNRPATPQKGRRAARRNAG